MSKKIQRVGLYIEAELLDLIWEKLNEYIKEIKEDISHLKQEYEFIF